MTGSSSQVNWQSYTSIDLLQQSLIHAPLKTGSLFIYVVFSPSLFCLCIQLGNFCYSAFQITDFSGLSTFCCLAHPLSFSFCLLHFSVINVHLFLFYIFKFFAEIFYFFAEAFYFILGSNMFVLSCYSIFVIVSLKSWSDNSDISVFLVLACIYYFLKLIMRTLQFLDFSIEICPWNLDIFVLCSEHLNFISIFCFSWLFLTPLWKK